MVMDKMVDKTLDGLYHEYSKINGTGLLSRFGRWILLKQIKRLEKEKEVKTDA